jgi:hypothetical protein
MIPVNPNIAARNADVNATTTYSDIPQTGAPVTFLGPGTTNDLCVWGTDAPLVPIPEPMNGTTACGPWSSNYNGATTTRVDWWAAVPIGIPEGLYWTVITMRIETI